MKKVRILSAVLALLFLFSLTACSSSKPVQTEPDPFEGLTLFERYEKNDPSVTATEVSIDLPVFDDVLKKSDFVVFAFFIEKDADTHRFAFKVQNTFGFAGIAHDDIVYTDPEPYDLIVEDTVTHEKEYRYQPIMGGDPYVVEGLYLLIGYYDQADGKPVAYYGTYVRWEDLGDAKFWGRDIFAEGEDYPASEFVPGILEEYFDVARFAEWCKNTILKNK